MRKIIFISLILICGCSIVKKTDKKQDKQKTTIITLDWRRSASPLLFGDEVFEELFEIASRIRKGDTVGENLTIISTGRTIYDTTINNYIRKNSPSHFVYKDTYRIPFDSTELNELASNSVKNEEKSFVYHRFNHLHDIIKYDNPIPQTDEDKKRLTDGNGTILQNYYPLYNDSLGTWNYNVTYANMSIQNYMLNGESIFYYPNGDTMAYGNYFNNKRNGLWVFRKYEKRKDSINFLEYTIEFKYGEIEGLYSLKKNNNLIYKFRIQDMKPTGNCEEYFESGQLKTKFHLNYCSHKLEFCEDYLSFHDLVMCTNQGDGNQFIVEYYIKNDFDDRYYFYKSQFDVFDRIEGSLESYYENGTLKSFFIFENGQVIRGKIFYENGSIWQEWDDSNYMRLVYSKERDTLKNESYINKCPN